MNAEKYLGQQYLPDHLVFESMNAIERNNLGKKESKTWTLIDIFNLGRLIGTRKERMLKHPEIRKVLDSCPSGHKAYKVSNNDLSPLGIEKGDIVICHHGVVPYVPLSDLVVYEKRNGGMRMGPYYGCYAKSQWAIWPNKSYRLTDFIGDSCVGVVSHIYNSKGELKYINETSKYPKEFRTDHTILKEPSNVCGVTTDNITYIYDVL